MLQAALRSGTAAPACGVRGLRPPAARGPPVRRGRRHRPRCSTRSSVPLRRRRARAPARAAGRRRRDAATGSPTTASPATSGATPRASATSPARPMLVVEGTFAEAVLLETLVLSILNHDCAIASAASRMTWPPATGPASRWARAAPTRRRRWPPPARRTSPASPPPPTSRPAAGTACPTAGTSAHAFTLLHDAEREAFAAQVAVARQGHDAARGHLRRRRGRAHRGRGRRPRAGRRPARLRRPAACWRPQVREPARRARRAPAPGSW